MRVRPCQTRYAESRSSPASRAISQGYWEAASASYPPPPKQPQSIVMPRAQTEAMPMMKTTNSSAGDERGAAGEQPEDEAGAHDQLEHRKQVADGGGAVAGQQLVGADCEHALVRVRQLEHRCPDPDPADDQARGGTEPLLHESTLGTRPEPLLRAKVPTRRAKGPDIYAH